MLTEGFSRQGDLWPTLERDAELRELGGLVASARDGGGRLALIEGEAGIGKTRLRDEAHRLAHRAGLRVLVARGGELEQQFGYGIVRQLLEPVLVHATPAGREELLAGVAALAERVFAAEPGEGADTDPAHAVLHGLYWLVANLSEGAPLLLAIDDVHWADGPSLRFLIHLARRLDGLPVAMLVTSRAGEGAARPELVGALALEASRPILRPEPLSEAAVARAVAGALGEGAGPMFCAACHEVTGGNPFLLSELFEELRHRPATEISAQRVRHLAPQRVGVSLLLRIGRIGPRALALARAVAVLGPQARLPHVRRLAGLEPAEARSLAVDLADAAVLEQGVPLRFRHPIVRSTIYDNIPAEEREARHARAAWMLAEEGADAETVAAHLLSTSPGDDAWVADTLWTAGQTVLARGAPETAARFLRRALDERPDQQQRGGVLLDLGTAEALVADPAAVEHLRRAVADLDTPDERVRASVRLAGVLAMTVDGTGEAVKVLERQIADVVDIDTDLAARLTAHAVNISRMGPSARRSTRRLSQRLAAQVVAGSTEPAVLATVAADMAMAGDAAERTAELAERALSGLGQARFTMSDMSSTGLIVRALLVAERFAPARQLLDHALHDARTRGDAIAVVMLSDHRVELLWQLGELSEAEAEASSSHAICVEQGWTVGMAAHAGRLIDIRVERGQIAAADALLENDSLAAPPEAVPDVYTFNLLLAARGHLRLAQARPDEALADLLECGVRLTELGELSPALVTWRRGAVRAHLARGSGADAQRLADEELVLARRHGGQRTLGVALRVTGLIEGGERGADLLTEAVSRLEQTEARLEHARALIDLGSVLRCAGQLTTARQRLSAGMDLAHRCDANGLVATAHQELRLAGARPRRVTLTGRDALTASERRVARMAAEGMTNKEIAQTLFLTLRTIEMHLSNAYRKLEIRSRHELGAALEDA